MKNKFFSSFFVLGLLLTMIVTPAPVRGDSFADDFIPGEVIVTLRPGRSINNCHVRFGTTTLEQLTGTTTYRVKLKAGDTVESVLDEIQADPDVQAAQPNLNLNRRKSVNQAWRSWINRGWHFWMAFLPAIFINNRR